MDCSRQRPARRVEEASFALAGRILSGMQSGLKDNLRIFSLPEAEGKPTAVSRCWSGPFGPDIRRHRIRRARIQAALPENRQGCLQRRSCVEVSHQFLTGGKSAEVWAWTYTNFPDCK